MIKIIVSIYIIIILAGCNQEFEIPVLTHELECKYVVYNGFEHTLKYKNELNETIVEYDNNKHTDVGQYIVTARFINGNVIKESTATLNIEPYKFLYEDFEFRTEVLYNGLQNEIKYNQQIIPENVEVYFKEINSYKEVGSYFNTLIIDSNNPNILSTEIEVNFNIVTDYKLDYVFESEFNNKEFIYNEKIQKPVLNNETTLLDLGFDIEYINEDSINVGKYDIIALIKKEDVVLHELSASYEINKKIFDPVLICPQNIKESIYYNFELEELEIDADIKISYFNVLDLETQIGKPLQFGNYLLKIEFSNYNENYIINDIYHYYTVELKDYDLTLINNAKLEDEVFIFDGNSKFIHISNQNNLRFERYVLTYTYNGSSVLPKDVGVYEVEANIIKNNIIIKTLYATLTIIET